MNWTTGSGLAAPAEIQLSSGVAAPGAETGTAANPKEAMGIPAGCQETNAAAIRGRPDEQQHLVEGAIYMQQCQSFGQLERAKKNLKDSLLLER